MTHVKFADVDWIELDILLLYNILRKCDDNGTSIYFAYTISIATVAALCGQTCEPKLGIRSRPPAANFMTVLSALFFHTKIIQSDSLPHSIHLTNIFAVTKHGC